MPPEDMAGLQAGRDHATARRRGAVAYARAVAVVAAAAAVAGAARSFLHVPDVDMLFLLGVVLVAVTSTRGPAMLAAVLSVAAYDFFFVAPAFTFEVEDARYVLTFVMMLGVGMVISTLAARLRAEEQAALGRERRTAALYEASRALGAARDEATVGAACVDVAARVVGRPVALLVRVADDAVRPLVASPRDTVLTALELELARWTAIQGRSAGGGVGAFPETPVASIPLAAAAEVRAVLVVREEGAAPIRAEQREFLEALCRQGALALERVRLAADLRAASLRAEAEQVRSALLSSVSHDLRTPLASITGAATTLREGVLDEGTRRELVDAVCEEAERLERLVRNLLDMTRLESGAVELRRVWVPVEEVIGSALVRLERQLAGREVTTACPRDLPLLFADPVLLQQLLLNLLENAAKYTPAGSPIEITAAAGDGVVRMEISDRGPGIAPGMEEAVFERFRRGSGPGVPGVGLGLAISRAIATAHGGTLGALRREGGGVVFRLVLPVTPAPAVEPAS